MAFSYNKKYEDSDETKRLDTLAKQNTNITKSGEVQKAAVNLYNTTQAKPADWTGGTYGEALKGAIDKIQNREKLIVRDWNN